MIAREMPFDVAAERRLLACCMIDGPAVVGRAIEAGLRGGCFYAEPHGVLFDLIVTMLGNGNPIEEVTVYQELSRRKMTDQFSGAVFGEIVSACYTTAGADQAIAVVAELAVIRRAIRIASEMVERCYAYKGGPVSETLAGPIEQLLALSSHDGKPEPTWNEVVDQAAALADEITSGVGRVTATIDFPWHQMNALFGPMERGQLVVLAARTSIGKSSLIRPIACTAARAGHKVYFDTLEVDPVKIAMQLAASLSRVGIRQLFGSHPEDQTDFKQALMSLKNAGITMSRKDRTLAQVVARAKALAAQGKLDLLVIDHGGQLRDVFESNDKVSAIGRVTKTLKQLAVELNCVVALLWQLNRGSTKENNREPILSDLKDSGSLEEDADKVIFIHRPSEDPITGIAQTEASTVAEQPRFFQNIIQAKGRDEGTSLMSFYFERSIATFTPAKK